MAASGSSGVTNLSQPRPRRTQVLLPEQTDAQVRSVPLRVEERRILI